MKKLLITLLIVSSLDAKIDSDTFTHVLTGVAIYAGCYIVKGAGESMHIDMSYLDEWTCLLPVVGAAVGKEVWDAYHRGHGTDPMDALATIAIPLTISFVVYEW